MEEISEFRNSKYTFSFVGTVYSEIIDKLKKGENVLFIGLPCQVAALKNIIQMYSLKGRLITVDLVCHGTPAPIYLQQHIQFIENKQNQSFEKCYFRDAKFDTSNFAYTLYTHNSKEPNYMRYVDQDDNYQIGYHNALIYREVNKFFLYVMMIISPITMILVKSSTALVCAIIADLAIILGLQKGKQRFSISAKGMLIGYLVFDVIIIVGAATFLGPIVSKLFGKDLTFSGRTLIWPQVILKIWQKPVAGWGYMSGEESGNLFGNLAFSSAHNQLLNTLWQGGVILLFIVMVLFLLTLNVYRKTTHKMETVAVLLVLVILVDMTFESILNVRATWLILLMLYNWGYLYSKYLIRMK